MGAIPKFAPLFIVDGVVRDWEKVDYTDRDTGVVRDNGRKVIMLTSQGFTELKIGTDPEDVRVEIPAIGTRWIVFAELSEWTMNNRAGTTLTYAAPVTQKHLQGMIDDIAPAAPAQSPAPAGKN